MSKISTNIILCFVYFLDTMYPQIDKDYMPSAPPPYSESQNAQNYMPGSQPSYPPPPMGSLQPTQVIVVQAPARKYPIFFCYFVNMLQVPL